MAKIATRVAYGDAIQELMKENKDIVVLDADLSGSTKSGNAKKVDPNRFFNMGIAEGNMMSVAAGLAASGKIVFASSFAMFATGRAYEQIRNSIGYPKMNVRICASHAGISVGEDGASHQCIEDINLMRAIPGMKVIVPCDYNEAKQCIKKTAYMDGPIYVRLGRSGVDEVYGEDYEWEFGKGSILREGDKDSKVAIVAIGNLVQEALAAHDELETKPTVVNMSTIKPIDRDLIEKLVDENDVIITAEDHLTNGGLGSSVAEVMAEYGHPAKLIRLGMKDTFGESGTPAELYRKYGIDKQAIVETIEGLK